MTRNVKIVATVGPASQSEEILEQLIQAGMNVARMNFSHGTHEQHLARIELIRKVSKKLGAPVGILQDLQGPKIRVGDLTTPLQLSDGERVYLYATESTPPEDSGKKIPVDFRQLFDSVRPADRLLLDDGRLTLEVVSVIGRNALAADVVIGGPLSSHKGINLPGVRLRIAGFTEKDEADLAFGISQNVDAVAISFVRSAEDVKKVRYAMERFSNGKRMPMLIAKLEKPEALDNLDAILEIVDGVMVARGDLGVELPIERIALVQKDVIRRANMAGRPVIAATQLLESMTEDELPTRAEATDVANAVLDGADCLMLSGESAIGKHPARCVSMLVQIAREIERLRPGAAIRDALAKPTRTAVPVLSDLAAASVGAMVNHFEPAAIVVSSRSGGTARSIARLRPIPWIIAVAESSQACAGLSFSSGVFPITGTPTGDDWTAFVRERIRGDLVDGDLFMLASGPSDTHPETGIRVEVIDLGRGS